MTSWAKLRSHRRSGGSHPENGVAAPWSNYITEIVALISTSCGERNRGNADPSMAELPLPC